MVDLQEHTGIEYVEVASRLLQRARIAHPTHGVWEAADLQWWWRTPRRTDAWPKPFWYDDAGPVVAVVATEWDGRIGLDILAVPDADPDLVGEAWSRGLLMLEEMGPIEAMVDERDDAAARVLDDAGFELQPGRGVAAWMPAPKGPMQTATPDGYTLVTREETREDSDHHFADRAGPDAEDRLAETSLYRPGLDLAAVDDEGAVAAYGLFWYDPTTKVGLVEPLGTHEAHRRKGLARLILTAGIDRLAHAGATRIKINYNAINPAASNLYSDLGFEPELATTMWTRDA